jgi:D-alanyl-D-alanine-carboxypeptidase/D-alanyl-D-alanine-endopeptidase
MLRRRLLLAALTVPTIGLPARAQTRAAANGPSSEDVRALLAERTGHGADSLGYVTGIIDAGGHRVVAVGQSGAADGRALDGDSVFEIGSVTKVFTALLMADMVQRGEVALDDPVAKYLPPEGRPRAYKDKPITLLELATHTSGLPKNPTNLSVTDPMNPYADYADYTVARLYEFLAGLSPLSYPGVNYEYSNVGFGLLGHVLALRAGRPYEELLVSRVCAPLGLGDTRITLTPSMRDRLAPGHDPGFYPFPAVPDTVLAGSGALRSTTNDLLRFLDGAQGRRQTSLAAAMAGLLKVRRQTDRLDEQAAEGWFVEDTHTDELIWKTGSTGGYGSYIGYSTRTQVAVVLLSNTRAPRSTFPLGRHLLNPVFMAPPLRHPVAIDPATLAAYAGRYSLSPQAVLTVTPRDDCLMMQMTGHMETEVFPVSTTNFFARDSTAYVAFDPPSDGSAPALLLYMGGRIQRAVRMP